MDSTGSDTSLLVELVGVGGEDGGHGEGVALGQFQTYARAQVAPRLRFGRHVVGDVGAEFVNERDFSFARAVAVASHLHFHVVGERHADEALRGARGVAVERALVG